MATPSSSPNSTPSAVPPSPATASPLPPNTPAPPPQTSQPRANPPSTASAPPTPSAPSAPPPDTPVSPPPQPPTSSSPPPQPPVSPASPPPRPPITSSPPPQPPVASTPAPPQQQPPVTSAPPPQPSSPPPPRTPPSSPPRASSPPPPTPPSSPPRESPSPPRTPPSSPPRASPSPPPPPPVPITLSPPPPSERPVSSPPSPPPSSSQPPRTSTAPPASEPPANSPPPPRRTPPPSETDPPANPPPTPESEPPGNAPPPPTLTPPASEPTPPSSNSPPTSSSPPKPLGFAPPPPQAPNLPSDNPPVNNPSPSSPDSSNSPGGNSLNAGAIVGIGVAVGLVILSLIGLAVWWSRKKKRRPSMAHGGYVMPATVGSSPGSDSAFLRAPFSPFFVGNQSSSERVYSPSDPGGLGHSKALFTYEELEKATNGFSTENLLGEGGFGCVYKGLLPDGREVAVKQLKIGGGQGDREFKAEVETISRIHHRHLVSLVGYCITENRRLLIYDYVPNNNLYYHLHGEGRLVLDWATRVKIAAGAARGLAYLHEDCHPRIIHRDIKSSNILLDNNFEARVSDFGLAKLALDANTHVTTRVIGTFGYMAPEYASSGKLTEKSDVYSFGVVLLELITGRKPVDPSQPLGDESLVEWARPLLSHALESEEFDDLPDPRLGGNYVESEMFRMIEAAAACVRHSAAKRPRMGQVVRAFDSLATEDLTNGMKLGESEIFNSAQQSEEIRWFRRMAFGSQNFSTDFFTHSSWNSREENV